MGTSETTRSRRTVRAMCVAPRERSIDVGMRGMVQRLGLGGRWIVRRWGCARRLLRVAREKRRQACFHLLSDPVVVPSDAIGESSSRALSPCCRPSFCSDASTRNALRAGMPTMKEELPRRSIGHALDALRGRVESAASGNRHKLRRMLHSSHGNSQDMTSLERVWRASVPTRDCAPGLASRASEA